MIKLKEMVKSKESMASGLQNNGQSHTSYKLYTSMSRALAVSAKKQPKAPINNDL